ncbi:hypothetical protein PAXINDRAFT_88116 [Paxillus involutus ATCC 200175]|uniref:WD40 repeat domain-containing protein n=1 Tax=Paxillus involutus ATCC 200175 TaxID=664439 RepID=A0A0C9SPH5_PAXIN|nr:hypothetical protein PAXINDRAFT_88116 [Paxillus involutus ATCC 200175]
MKAPQQYTEEPRPSSQTPLKVLKGHTRTVGGLAFFLDGCRIVSGSWDRSLIIWDVTVGEVEKKLAGHTGDIMSIAMAPDGRVFASGSEDGTLRFWDGSTGNEVGEPIHTLSTGKRGVWGLAFSPDSRRIATTGNHTIQICGTVGVWNSVSGKVVFNSLKGHTDAVMWTAFTPNGRQLVTASIDGTICRWDMKSGALIGKPLTGHSDWIYNGVLSRDGNTLATASADRTVRLWDLKTGNQKSRFLQHRFSVRRVALSRDGSLLATAGSGGDVYIWDMKTIEAG